MKKKPQGKSLIPAKLETDLTVERVLAHPAVQEMSARLATVQKMLGELPRMIGEAVAEAQRNQAPVGAKGPPVKLVDHKDVEIHKDRLVVDGKRFETKDRKDFR